MKICAIRLRAFLLWQIACHTLGFQFFSSNQKTVALQNGCAVVASVKALFLSANDSKLHHDIVPAFLKAEMALKMQGICPDIAGLTFGAPPQNLTFIAPAVDKKELRQYHGPKLGIRLFLLNPNPNQLALRSEQPCGTSWLTACVHITDWHLEPQIDGRALLPVPRLWRNHGANPVLMISEMRERACSIFDDCIACGATGNMNLFCPNGTFVNVMFALSGDLYSVKIADEPWRFLWPVFGEAMTSRTLETEEFGPTSLELLGPNRRILLEQITGTSPTLAVIDRHADPRTWQVFKLPSGGEKCCEQDWNSNTWQVLQYTVTPETQYVVSNRTSSDWCADEILCRQLAAGKSVVLSHDGAAFAVLPRSSQDPRITFFSQVSRDAESISFEQGYHVNIFYVKRCVVGFAEEWDNKQKKYFAVAAGSRCMQKERSPDPFRATKFTVCARPFQPSSVWDASNQCAYSSSDQNFRRALSWDEPQCHRRSSATSRVHHIDLLPKLGADVFVRSQRAVTGESKCEAFPWKIADTLANEIEVPSEAAAMGCAIIVVAPRTLQTNASDNDAERDAMIQQVAESLLISPNHTNDLWNISACASIEAKNSLVIRARCAAAAPPVECTQCSRDDERLRCDGLCVPKDAALCPPGEELDSSLSFCKSCREGFYNAQRDGACRPCPMGFQTNSAHTGCTDFRSHQNLFLEERILSDTGSDTEETSDSEDAPVSTQVSVSEYEYFRAMYASPARSETDEIEASASQRGITPVQAQVSGLTQQSDDLLSAPLSQAATSLSSASFLCSVYSEDRLQPICPVTVSGRLEGGRILGVRDLRFPLPLELELGRLSTPVNLNIIVSQTSPAAITHSGLGDMWSSYAECTFGTRTETFAGPGLYGFNRRGGARIQILYSFPESPIPESGLLGGDAWLVGCIWFLGNQDDQGLRMLNVFWSVSYGSIVIKPRTHPDRNLRLSALIEEAFTRLGITMRIGSFETSASHVALPALRPSPEDGPMAIIVQQGRGIHESYDVLWDLSPSSSSADNDLLVYGLPLELSLAWPRDVSLPHELFPDTLCHFLQIDNRGDAAVFVSLHALSWSVADEGEVVVLLHARPRIRDIMRRAQDIYDTGASPASPAFASLINHWSSENAVPFLLFMRLRRGRPDSRNVEFLNYRRLLLTELTTRRYVPEVDSWGWSPIQAVFISDSAYRTANVGPQIRGGLPIRMRPSAGGALSPRLLSVDNGFACIVGGNGNSPPDLPLAADATGVVTYTTGSRLLFFDTARAAPPWAQAVQISNLPDFTAGGFILPFETFLVAFAVNPADGRPVIWQHIGRTGRRGERFDIIAHGEVNLAEPFSERDSLPPPPLYGTVPANVPFAINTNDLPLGNVESMQPYAAGRLPFYHLPIADVEVIETASAVTMLSPRLPDSQTSSRHAAERWRQGLHDRLRPLVLILPSGRIVISEFAAATDEQEIYASYVSLHGAPEISASPRSAILTSAEVFLEGEGANLRNEPINRWTLSIHSFIEVPDQAAPMESSFASDTLTAVVTSDRDTTESDAHAAGASSTTTRAEPCQVCGATTCCAHPGEVRPRMNRLSRIFSGAQSTIRGGGPGNSHYSREHD